MTRPTEPPTSEVLRTYRVRPSLEIFYLAVVLTGTAAVILEPRLWFVFVPLSVSLLWAVFKLRRVQVTISADAIEVRGAGKVQRMLVEDMRGYRKVKGRYPAFYFAPRDETVTGLRVADAFDVDADFEGWLSRIPDLGAQEREAAAREEAAEFQQRQAEFERRDAAWRGRAAARPPE